MKAIRRVDGFIGRHMAILVLCCAASGILFPDFFAWIKPLAVWLFAFMTFANSLSGGFRELWNVVTRPLPVIAAFFLLHIVMPLITLGLGNLLFPDAPLFTTGLVLNYALPTAVGALMWADISRGNTLLCLSILLLDTLLSPFIVPLTLKVLLGAVVKIEVISMMKDLLLMVGIPALIGMTMFQTSKGKVAKTWKPALAPFAKVALLAVILSNATGCAPFLRNITPTLTRVMIAVFALCLLGFFLGYWTGIFLKFDFPTVQTVAITSGMRNISAGAVLAMQYFPPDVLFPVAFSPIFLQISTAIIVKILRKTKPGRADQAAYEATHPEIDL